MEPRSSKPSVSVRTFFGFFTPVMSGVDVVLYTEAKVNNSDSDLRKYSPW